MTYDAEEIVSKFKAYYGSGKRINLLVDFINKYNNKELPELFIEYNTPIFVIIAGKYFSWYPHILIANPILEDVKFQRVMDPFTAFQEISMFLGDTLKMRDKPITEIPDKYRISAHGFDKWSFRREHHPSKPRKRKK